MPKLRYSCWRGLLAAALLSASGLRAQGLPPLIQVQTGLTAPLYQLAAAHFTAVAPRGDRRLAQTILAEAELARRRVLSFLGGKPPHTYLLVSSNTDLFNGFATPLPYPTIRVYATFPEPYQIGLRWPNLWLDLIGHEFTHIDELTATTPAERSLRSLLGNIPLPGLTSARLPPAWFLEGLAVLMESEVSGHGRVQSHWFRLFRERTALHRWPNLTSLGLADYPRWPFGNARYLFGSAFLAFIAERDGFPALRRLIRTFDRAPLDQPFSAAWKAAIGESEAASWKAFAQHERAGAAQLPPAAYLGAQTFGSYAPPAFRRGRLAWWGNGAIQMAKVVQGRLVGRQQLPLNQAPTSLAWMGRTLLFTAAVPWPSGATDELFAYRHRRLVRLTDHQRARWVACSGKSVYLIRQVGLRSEIWQLGGKRIWSAPRGDHLLSLSARGGRLLFTLWIPGGRHLLLELREGRLSQLAAPGDVTDASLGPGGAVLYSSDRSGSPLSYQLGSGRPLSRPGGGSFGARWSGRQLFFLTLTARGFAPVLASAPEPLSPARQPRRETVRLPSLPLPPLAHWIPYPAVPRPIGWVPASPYGLGLTLYGTDPAGLSAWSAALGWTGQVQLALAGQEILSPWLSLQGQAALAASGAAADLTLTWSLPTPLPAALDFGLSLFPEPAAGISFSTGDLVSGLWETPRSGGALTLAWSPQALGWSALAAFDHGRWRLDVSGEGSSRGLSWMARIGPQLALPLRWRLDGSLLALERLSWHPSVELGSQGIQFGNAFGLDFLINYLQPLALEIQTEIGGNGLSEGFGIRLPIAGNSSLQPLDTPPGISGRRRSGYAGALGSPG